MTHDDDEDRWWWIRACFITVAVLALYGLVVTLALAFGPSPYGDSRTSCLALGAGAASECPQSRR